nr:hypothetical protein [uncultured Roseateles sp.]
MIYALEWAQDSLDGDMQQLGAADPVGLALLNELFDVLEQSEIVCERLAESNYDRITPHPKLNTCAVQTFCDAGYNICRIKVWHRDGGLPAFRVLYGVDHSTHSRRIVILGVMGRSVDYEIDSEFGERIREDYENIGIPRIPGRH